MPNVPGHAAPKDSDILELLKSGSRDRAFEQLLDRYEAKLYRLCCALLRDPARAQDAAQESWLRIWKALPQFDGRASLSTWIYAITRNRCLTALARHPNTESLSEPQVESEVEALFITFNEDCDQASLLRGMIDRLPERSRQVLLLYYFEERSVKEVAAMLAMGEGAVKTNLLRARAALLEVMRRQGLDSADAWLKASA